MPRALLVLLAVATLVVLWLLKSTQRDHVDEAPPREPSETAAPTLAGPDLGEATEGPDLSTSEDGLSPEERSSAARTHERARAALHTGPAPAGVPLRGVVRDASGAALIGVRVVASGQRRTIEWRTDENGAFERTLPAGRYDLLLGGKGVARLLSGFRVDGAAGEYEFTLQDTGAIVVAVLREDEPVSGVTIRAEAVGLSSGLASSYELVARSSTTGPAGIARLESLPAGRYKVSGRSRDGLRILGSDLDLPGGTEHEVTLRLPPTVTFTGSVRLHGEGAPIADARIELVLSSGDTTLLTAFDTRADGTFEVEVPRGRPVRLLVEAEGFAPFPPTWDGEDKAALRDLRGLLGPKPVHYDIELVRRGTLDGSVHNAQDRPLPGVLVEVRPLGAREPAFRATSDADGRFALHPLAAGEYEVEVLTPGLYPLDQDEPRVWIGPHEEPMQYTLMVQEARRISGRVVTPSGEGVPAARVWVLGEGLKPLPARGEEGVVESYTSSDGSFVLSDLPSNVELTVRAALGSQEALPVRLGPPDEGDGDVDVDVDVDVPGPLRLVLKPAGAIEGVVVDRQTRQPLADVAVDVRPAGLVAGRARLTLRSGADGRFRARLLPGPWTITPEREGYLSREGEKVIIGPLLVPVRLELDPGVLFQGTTQAEDGRPLPGALITVYKIEGQERMASWTTRSDARGRFRLSGLGRGAEYVLVATSAGYHAVTREELRSARPDMALQLRRRER